MKLTPEDLEGIYGRRFAKRESYRNEVWRVLTRHFFQKFVATDGAVLDLGCGYGEFINNVTARSKYAMDLNPAAKHLLSPEVRLFSQDCSTRWPLPDGALDVVFTSNFLEHLVDKESIAATLREARRCLRPGGSFIAMGPNIRCLPGSYWDFWDHHVPLTELSLSEALHNNGFRVVVSYRRFLPYSMAHGPRYPTFLLRLYLSLPAAWRLLGRQFLVIGRTELS